MSAGEHPIFQAIDAVVARMAEGAGHRFEVNDDGSLHRLDDEFTGDPCAQSEDGAVWSCPKPGCELDSDHHNFALAVEHIYETTPEVAEAVFGRVTEALIGKDADDE